MIDLETVVCYKHKETDLCLDVKYIKGNAEKNLRLLEGLYKAYEKDYKVKDIPFSDDWEMVLNYFSPNDYMRIMRGEIDKELNERLVKLIDERKMKNGK